MFRAFRVYVSGFCGMDYLEFRAVGFKVLEFRGFQKLEVLRALRV